MSFRCSISSGHCGTENWRRVIPGMPRDWSGRHHRRHLFITSRKALSSPKRLMHMTELVEQQFDNIEQQRDAAYTGMWIFLSTEVLFFGGVFFTYVIYRGLYYDAFVEGSRELSVFLGGLNTAVLLCSSLFMALAVNAAQRGRNNHLVIFLVITE